MENNTFFKWYMVSTISGKEEKVIESLRNVVSSEMLEDICQEIKMFVRPHLTLKELQKRALGQEFKVKKENLYKGYIFIKIHMTDKAWFLIRNTQYVTGLVGSSGKGAKPTPLSQKQIDKMFKKELEEWKKYDMGIIDSPFKPGSIVEIIEGPFKGEEGPIIEVDDKEQTALVSLEIFGKKTPTKVSHNILKLK
ncbi:transcription termination/antitermination protein NusG [Mesomycoplasma neurolyticum]|uniref:Transcription termination/antitermination protein NusG n=1 Tax=Mesomycoplasma neurolyticum TaxID=2120 RepID=A0A449A6F3_9BACT|nr:transcription termination/antitermination protein NusG [Mesomycoplasma neurolyticum]VEU59797.1 Transcription antitermination protein nusG [Mesomycoplasma neurolyticum]